LDIDDQPAHCEIHILNSGGMSSALFRSTTRIESCDALIRVYDEAGNVIETHEHKGDLKKR
jgi:hypothetical protein